MAGATYTSKAVVDALNALLVTEEPAAEEEPAADVEVLKGSAMGFESDVRVEVTLNEDGTDATLKENASEETEGIGKHLSGNEEFAAQFIGKAAPFTIGENVDAVAGATYTSKAVVDALNALLVTEEPAAEEEPAVDVEVLKGSAMGFESDVKVEVTLNEDGTVATLKVNASEETEGIGKNLSGNEEFAAQFIGKAAPFTIGENVDAVAGATYTSKAVVDALNALLVTEEPVAEAEVLTASGQGFESEITVKVTLNADGTVATLEVDASGETRILGGKASGEAFTSQFIGKTAPFALGEGIDAVTAATTTCQTVVDLVNGLLGK